jgi:3-dehydroquinate synthase II
MIPLSGETSKTYASLRPKDSREFQYTLQPSDVGTFNLDPATATYSDEEGNYHTAKSKTAAITVIPSTDQPATPHTTKKSSADISTASVHLHGEKTQYLSELSAGDGVIIVNARGEQRDGIVGRVKIEKRPLTLVKAEVDGNTITTILQNAETIKLVGADGRPISIANLKVGDEVLVHFEDSARHFGMKIDETIIEK